MFDVSGLPEIYVFYLHLIIMVFSNVLLSPGEIIIYVGSIIKLLDLNDQIINWMIISYTIRN